MSRFSVHDLNFSVTVMVFPVRSGTDVMRDELVVEKLQYFQDDEDWLRMREALW